MANTRAGRPRSEQAHDAILDATRDLLNEKGGAGLTIEAVAKRAGVGKPTIYRWWPTSADIVLEVVRRQAETAVPIPHFDSARETLHQYLRRSMSAVNGPDGVHLRFLMAHAQMDDAFRERFRLNFTAARRAALRSVLSQALEQGRINPQIDLETALDIIFGVMWYRFLIGHGPLDESLAEKLTLIIVGPS